MQTTTNHEATNPSDASASGLGTNKQTVLAFYELALNNKDFDRACRLIGPRYVQHNPLIADDVDGLKGSIDYLRVTFPATRRGQAISPRAHSSSRMSTGSASPASAAPRSWTSSGSRTERSSSTGIHPADPGTGRKRERDVLGVRDVTSEAPAASNECLLSSGEDHVQETDKRAHPARTGSSDK